MQPSHTDQFDNIIEQLVNLNIEKAKAIEELEALNIEEDPYSINLKSREHFHVGKRRKQQVHKRRERIVQTNLPPSIHLQQSRPSPNQNLQRTS